MVASLIRHVIKNAILEPHPRPSWGGRSHLYFNKPEDTPCCIALPSLGSRRLPRECLTSLLSPPAFIHLQMLRCPGTNSLLCLYPPSGWYHLTPQLSTTFLCWQFPNLYLQSWHLPWTPISYILPSWRSHLDVYCHLKISQPSLSLNQPLPCLPHIHKQHGHLSSHLGPNSWSHPLLLSLISWPTFNTIGNPGGSIFEIYFRANCCLPSPQLPLHSKLSFCSHLDLYSSFQGNHHENQPRFSGASHLLFLLLQDMFSLHLCLDTFSLVQVSESYLYCEIQFTFLLLKTSHLSFLWSPLLLDSALSCPVLWLSPVCFLL
jgi:hypothetical protein